MEDKEVIDRINGLADEEHALFERESAGTISRAERTRLTEIGLQLDQCWDLLHQRRARRNAGLDPDQASIRDVTTVEGYVD